MRLQETRLAELDQQEHQGLAYTNDAEEGALEEGVEVYESRPDGRFRTDPGLNYTNDTEEGQLEDDVPMYELGSRASMRRARTDLSYREAEAIRAKERHIAKGLESSNNPDEAGAVEDGVPAYDVNVCSVM